MVFIFEASPPAQWRPKIERVGALRWRVRWLWFGLSRVDVRGINELFAGTIANMVARCPKCNTPYGERARDYHKEMM